MKALNLIGVAVLMACVVACKKSTPPTVKIYDNAISVSYTSANVTGEVTNEGSSPVTDRGFIYGKQGESRQDTLFCGSGGGEFPTRLAGLVPNTTYNCTAFARNDAGIAYSGKATFTTFDYGSPVIITEEVRTVTDVSATCGGTVITDGGAEVTARGVCWGTMQNPTITNDSYTTDGTGEGSFSTNLTGLSPNTNYYVRAYATNRLGTSYGEQKTFKTPKPGVLGGKFSVSGNRKVCFSKGNLQYNPSTHTWCFAESQLEYIGSNNSNISPSYNGWIDLFGWGTGNNPINSSTNSSDYGTFTDWGNNPIANGGNNANQWRTLTSDEWEFLLFNRNTNSNIRFTKAVVNGVNGVIILPDDWDESYYTLEHPNMATDVTIGNVCYPATYGFNRISLNDWMSILEVHGAVFLPAAGGRVGTTVHSNGEFGFYWSTSSYNNYRYVLGFGGDFHFQSYNDLFVDYYHSLGNSYWPFYGYFDPECGFSVRLVTE